MRRRSRIELDLFIFTELGDGLPDSVDGEKRLFSACPEGKNGGRGISGSGNLPSLAGPERQDARGSEAGRSGNLYMSGFLLCLLCPAGS